MYISNFATNLISISILENKGLYFFPLKRCLTNSNQKPRFFFIRNGSYYILEDNSNNLPIAALAAKIALLKSGTLFEQHQLLAHAGGNAIYYLTKAVKGVEVTDSNKVPLINKYNVYT